MREMVKIYLYEDGTYELKDTDSHLATQRLGGFNPKGHYECYICRKDKWKYYLLKLVSTKDIDRKIAQLKQRKKTLEELRERLKMELLDE